jgi:hypothetical protein
MIDLREAIVGAKAGLSVLNRVKRLGLSLVEPIDALSRAFTVALEGNDDAILMVKSICEDLVNRASDAERANYTHYAQRLRAIGFELSSVVASYYRS